MPWQLAIGNQSLASAVYNIVVKGEVSVTDLLSVDPDALVDLHQMRRGVKARAHARLFQNRGQSRCCRPFSVGSSNKDSRNAYLRVVQLTKQHPHIGQVKLQRGGLA